MARNPNTTECTDSYVQSSDIRNKLHNCIELLVCGEQKIQTFAIQLHVQGDASHRESYKWSIILYSKQALKGEKIDKRLINSSHQFHIMLCII